MRPDKIILARPNSLIVNEIKRLISELSGKAVPLGDLKDIGKIDYQEVAGIVISTAVNSVVSDPYIEVLKQVVVGLPGKPVFLTTLMEADILKRSLSVELRRSTLSFNFLSIEEAIAAKVLSPAKDVVIIRKKDLTDPDLFLRSKVAFQKATGLR